MSNLAFPAPTTELDAGFAAVCGKARGSLESSSEERALANNRISRSCAIAACWQGFMISRGMVLGCTFCLVALIDVLYQVLKETLTGEESLENTLARGTLRKTTLEFRPTCLQMEGHWHTGGVVRHQVDGRN